MEPSKDESHRGHFLCGPFLQGQPHRRPVSVPPSRIRPQGLSSTEIFYNELLVPTAVHGMHDDTADMILTIDPLDALKRPAEDYERLFFRVRPTSSRRPRSLQTTSPSRVRPMLLRHLVREAMLLMKGECRSAPRGGCTRPLLQVFRDEFPTLTPRAFHSGCAYVGLTAVYGTVRCRVRTEQNLAPTRSTAAAATMQPLSS